MWTEAREHGGIDYHRLRERGKAHANAEGQLLGAPQTQKSTRERGV